MMMDGSGHDERRPTRCVYNGGGNHKQTLSILGRHSPFFTKRWHPRQEDDDMDGEGGGRVYWSSLAGFRFIHHGWRSFFAVSHLKHDGQFPQGMVWAWGLFFSVSIHITSPIRFNQFVSLLACFFLRGKHNTQHDRRGYRMTG